MTTIKDDPKYAKLGVTPEELYLRQNGLCWLRVEMKPGGEVLLFCTDGEDKAETCKMLNPSYECVKCMSNFALTAVRTALERSPIEYVTKDTEEK